LISSSLLQLVSTWVAMSVIAVISFSDGLIGKLEIDGVFFSGLDSFALHRYLACVLVFG
jgi:hypothetical protein